jgi:ABC-type multidrug transport system fused ATPase/permease subunit
VGVRYPDAQDWALRHVSLVIPSGASVALVGSSGAGKSTLADVILGVIHPQEGVVRVADIPPQQAIARWSGSMAYVPQAVALVEGSIRQNVALGIADDHVDDDLVWEALERARLDVFLRETREGLSTEVGERGVRLSGGQRQRLGIARALYTRPRLLVLDEATSALDAETELAIVQTLKDLEGAVTTITIAHRLATVRTVNKIVFMKDGRVVSEGSFEDVRSVVPDFDRQASLLGL